MRDRMWTRLVLRDSYLFLLSVVADLGTKSTDGHGRIKAIFFKCAPDFINRDRVGFGLCVEDLLKNFEGELVGVL